MTLSIVLIVALAGILGLLTIQVGAHRLETYKIGLARSDAYEKAANEAVAAYARELAVSATHLSWTAWNVAYGPEAAAAKQLQAYDAQARDQFPRLVVSLTALLTVAPELADRAVPLYTAYVALDTKVAIAGQRVQQAGKVDREVWVRHSSEASELTSTVPWALSGLAAPKAGK